MLKFYFRVYGIKFAGDENIASVFKIDIMCFIAVKLTFQSSLTLSSNVSNKYL